jgi:hypothetical protein
LQDKIAELTIIRNIFGTEKRTAKRQNVNRRGAIELSFGKRSRIIAFIPQ